MRRLHALLLLGFSSLFLSCAGLILLTFVGCTPAPDYWKDAKPGQKRVLVSFPPLYCITSAVAGDKAYVLSLLTVQGPHHYEATPMDAFKANKADVFIYNGLTMDDDGVWANMQKSLKNKKLEVLNVGEALLKKDWDLIIHAKDAIKHQNPDGGWHIHGKEDPHYWLG